MRSQYSSPYVVYNGKIAILENALHFIKKRKGKDVFTISVIKEKIEIGEMIIVKKSEKRKCALLDYDSLRPTVKMTLKLKYGFPPKIINE
ncbi:hypothetical protein QLS31_15215 [Flavobacterium sp. XS2P24]|uniref:hypothetical protein n=1 Tax=Flavobacterium sp. XS2P24 TaxID=3041249 RepID=UPI0024A82B7A|nr:hypothetical protein [Flavobacterium sp. XS2P24]MDI6051177.1 hypothetical protein [Flavobacterium sp. XS2P24]